MKKRKGSALFMVLLTMIILSIVILAISTSFTANLRMVTGQQNQHQAYYYALGGIEIGTAILNSQTELAIPDPDDATLDTTMHTLFDLYQLALDDPGNFHIDNPNLFRPELAAEIGADGVGFLSIPNDNWADDPHGIIFYDNPDDPFDDEGGTFSMVGEALIDIWLDTVVDDGKNWIRLRVTGIAYNSSGNEISRHTEFKSFDVRNSNVNNTFSF